MKFVIDIDLEHPTQVYAPNYKYYVDSTSGIQWMLSDETIQKLIPLEEAKTQLSDKDATFADKGTTSDLISRHAAIEALFDWEMHYDWDEHYREENPKSEYIVSPSDVIEKLPSAQPEYEPVKAEDFAKIMSENTPYGFLTWNGVAFTLIKEMGFVICKKTM